MRMTVSVLNQYEIKNEVFLPYLELVLTPKVVQQLFEKHLRQYQFIQLLAIRVTRYKPGRRCLIEYDVAVETQARAENVTLIGKVRARGLDNYGYQLLKALWNAGFDDYSGDLISVPQPVGVIPELQMWLQRKVPGTVATHLLTQPKVATQIAIAAHKLHQTKITPRRSHTMTAELQILRDRLPRVAQLYPQWQQRLERLLTACARVGETMPQPVMCGIHRDFYPDQVLVDNARIYLLDLDLYCTGDPALDIGNFIAHITEQSLRTLGNPDALLECETAISAQFMQLNPAVSYEAIQLYKMLTLVRHIYISTQIPERQAFTEALLDLCEQRYLGVRSE